jgi:hypothetical protein
MRRSTAKVEQLYFQRKKGKDNDKAACDTMCATAGATGGATMTVTESKNLKKGTRVYWQGNAAGYGIITETSWDAVTITWNNGQVATVHHGRADKVVYCVKAAVISPDRIHLSEAALFAGESALTATDTATPSCLNYLIHDTSLAI